jgi:hypothetical protein
MLVIIGTTLSRSMIALSKTDGEMKGTGKK